MSPRVPSAAGHRDRVGDDECFDPRLIAEITLLATPIDFDDLIARGILKQASANWYWLLIPSRELPDGFSRRIAAATSSSKGLRVRFWSVKAAAKVALTFGVPEVTPTSVEYGEEEPYRPVSVWS